MTSWRSTPCRAFASSAPGGRSSCGGRRARFRSGISRARRDRAGWKRWTDCEWDLADGRTLVLEVDGAFHLEVEQYTSDMRRQRRLTTVGRIVVRCSAQEIREDPGAVMEDLLALGVQRLAA